MVAEGIRQMTVAEYLDFEAASEIKHEFIDGDIFVMTGGTLFHSLIIMNAGAALRSSLSASDCMVLSSDMRVRVGTSRYVYPDLSVMCGEAVTENNSTTLLNPILVAEVTSPSSIDYDRVIKRDYYGAVDSIQAYLVIDQHRVLAELYTRTETGWHLQQFSDLEAAVSLEMLGCELPLAEVYRGVTFDETASSASLPQS